MKVLHLLKINTGARWALQQLRELTRLGIECHVVLPAAGGVTPLYAAAGIQVHVIDLNGMPFTPRFFAGARALAALCREIAPDIAHSHFVVTTLAMRYALRGQGCARVFQVAGPLHLESAMVAHVELATAGREDYWIASCEWTRNKYRELGVAANHVFLSHYGMETEAFVPGSHGALRAELGLTPATRLVGMVAYCYRPKKYLGSRRGIKGHEDFSDAIGLLRRGGVDVVGVVAGGAWRGADQYYTEVQDYARANADTKVFFLGSRSDVLPVYADLDVAVHPSLSENLGGAAESLLLAVPTVTTNIGGFPDLMIEGVTGRMVPPGAPAQLAAAIRQMLDDRHAAMAMAMEGERRTRKLLDVRLTAGQVAAIYERILPAHRARRTRPAEHVHEPAHGHPIPHPGRAA